MSMFRWPEDDGIHLDPTYWGNEQEPAPGDNNVQFTSASRRFGAICLDWLLPCAAVWVIGNEIGDLVLLTMLGNSIFYQGMTGHSLGKQALGLRLAYVPERKDQTTWTFLMPGVARCGLRYVLHILDVICFIGFFKCLMNPWGRSFADALCSTVVIQDDKVQLMSMAEYRSGVSSG
jgi:uncharacterized RDD family membrane protein YckC